MELGEENFEIANFNAREFLGGVIGRISCFGEVVSNLDSHVLLSFMKMTLFHAMELAKESRLPSYPMRGLIAHVNLLDPHNQFLQILVLSESDENSMAQGLVKWKEMH